LQKNNVKIGFTSLLVFCSVASIEKKASAVGRRIETAYFLFLADRTSLFEIISTQPNITDIEYTTYNLT